MKATKQLKGVMSVSQLIGAVLIAVVLGALIGTVADQTIGINQSVSNVTGATYIMVGLVPLFLVIGIIISYVSDI